MNFSGFSGENIGQFCSIVNGYKKGQLHITKREGMMNNIPKGDTPIQYI